MSTELEYQLKALKLPDPVKEHRFCERRWRFDYAWPDRMIAVELEGGIYSNGRHVRGKGYEADMQKYNMATILGWKLYRFSYGMVKNGEAIGVLENALKGINK